MKEDVIFDINKQIDQIDYKKLPDNTIPKKKSDSRLKWVILIISSLILFGDYYSYDTPYACKDLLEQTFSEYTNEEYLYLFNMLYTIYQIPNVFLPFIIGIIIDKFGNRIMLPMLGLCIFLGVLIVDIGVHLESFAIMLIGRSIFALGGDSLTVSLWTLATEYFEENRIGVILSWISIVASSASSLNMWLSPIIGMNYGVTKSFDVAVLICFCSLILGFILCLCDKCNSNNFEKIAKRQSDIQEKDNQMEANTDTSEVNINTNACSRLKNINLGSRYWLNLTFGIAMSLSQMGFYYFCAGYLAQKWWSTEDPITAYNNAIRYNIIHTGLDALAVPIIGWITDKYEIYNELGIWSPIALIFSFILFMTMFPLIPMIIFTIVTSASYCAHWGCMARCVEQDKMGIGTGINYCIYNIFLAIIPTIDTFIQNEWNYEDVFIFLILVAFIALFAALRFNFEDKIFKLTAANSEDTNLENENQSNEQISERISLVKSDSIANKIRKLSKSSDDNQILASFIQVYKDMNTCNKEDLISPI